MSSPYMSGVLLLCTSLLLFVSSLYTMLIAKLLPDNYWGVPAIDAIKYDW